MGAISSAQLHEVCLSLAHSFTMVHFIDGSRLTIFRLPVPSNV